jgi:hypothetical protein
MDNNFGVKSEYNAGKKGISCNCILSKILVVLKNLRNQCKKRYLQQETRTDGNSQQKNGIAILMD